MNGNNSSAFPLLTTPKFVLRRLTVEDQNEIFILRSDPRVLLYLDTPPAKSLDDAYKFIEKINNGESERKWNYWAISFKNEAKLVGTICLWNISEDLTSADIGFTLLPDFQGRGIMQEVLPEVLNYGFTELHLEKIRGEVAPKNIKSINLLIKFGFTRTEEFKHTSIYTLSRNWKRNRA